MNIGFEDIITEKCLSLSVMLVEADVVNTPTSEELEAVLDDVCMEIAGRYQLGEINKRPGIAATRAAYKALGKEPNRYRPANEQLCRRVVRGLGLYRVNALVDVINVMSLRSGYAIGGFDADKIKGDTLTLGVGRHEEPYEGIGRGPLNIENMPVFRDEVGGVGTPTSDNERTKLSLDTRRLVMTVNMYGEEMSPAEFAEMATGLLERFASATNIRITLHKS